MKITDVESRTPLERFLYWIKERHAIYLRKESGKPKPWTDDEVMQQYFFTNPYRENDKVTRWFRDRVRGPLENDPRVLMATVIFRWFNRIETGEQLLTGSCDGTPYGWLEKWDQKKVLKYLGGIRDNGGQIFTGAFMINSPGGRPKLEAICERIQNVWVDRVRLLNEIVHATTLKDAHTALTRYPGLGGFMAYEIVCDLRYTYLLRDATDKLTWCNPGPGAVRGLYRVLGREFEKGNNASSPPKPKDFDEQLKVLLNTARRQLNKMPPLEMREIEHSLCEFDKYERARLGDGRMKRTYDGV